MARMNLSLIIFKQSKVCFSFMRLLAQREERVIYLKEIGLEVIVLHYHVLSIRNLLYESNLNQLHFLLLEVEEMCNELSCLILKVLFDLIIQALIDSLNL
jgi:hypothetical protein